MCVFRTTNWYVCCLPLYHAPSLVYSFCVLPSILIPSTVLCWAWQQQHFTLLVIWFGLLCPLYIYILTYYPLIGTTTPLFFILPLTLAWPGLNGLFLHTQTHTFTTHDTWDWHFWQAWHTMLFVHTHIHTHWPFCICPHTGWWFWNIVCICLPPSISLSTPTTCSVSSLCNS